MDLPGKTQDDVELSVKENTLTIATKETVPAEKGKDKENDEESKSLARQNSLNARFRFQQLKVS